MVDEGTEVTETRELWEVRETKDTIAVLFGNMLLVKIDRRRHPIHGRGCMDVFHHLDPDSKILYLAEMDRDRCIGTVRYKKYLEQRSSD